MGGKSWLHRKIGNSLTVIFTATGIIAASLVSISYNLDSDEVFFKSPYSKPIPGQSSASEK